MALAREAKRCVLDNGNAPQLPSLSEADTAEMESFLEEMLLIYPVLGLMVFEKPPAERPGQRVLFLKGRGITARGYEAAEGFVVLAGSQAAKDTVPSIQNYLVVQRAGLLERGILVPEGECLRLAQDYTFDSPSTAASVMMGRTLNGRELWKDQDGRMLKQIQTAAIGDET